MPAARPATGDALGRLLARAVDRRASARPAHWSGAAPSRAAGLIQRFVGSARDSLEEILEAIRNRWEDFAGAEQSDRTSWIRGLIHEAPAPETDVASPDLSTVEEVLEAFPPEAAERCGAEWVLDVCDADGRQKKLSAVEARDEANKSLEVGLVYYALSEEAVSFRLGINVRAGAGPKLAQLLLATAQKHAFIVQFKVPAPGYGDDLLDAATVYYTDTPDTLANTNILTEALKAAHVGALTREEHSGLMEPLAGVRGIGFSRQKPGTAYSKERASQIAAALAPLTSSGTPPTLEELRAAVEKAGISLADPHLSGFG